MKPRFLHVAGLLHTPRHSDCNYVHSISVLDSVTNAVKCENQDGVRVEKKKRKERTIQLFPCGYDSLGKQEFTEIS